MRQSRRASTASTAEEMSKKAAKKAAERMRHLIISGSSVLATVAVTQGFAYVSQKRVTEYGHELSQPTPPSEAARQSVPKLTVQTSKLAKEFQVERPALFSAIRDWVADCDPELSEYMVIVGPPGSGKTSAVQLALAGRPGVIDLTHDTSKRSLDVGRDIQKKLGIDPTKMGDTAEVAGLLTKAQQDCASELDGKPIVVIVDAKSVSAEGNPVDLWLAADWGKELSADRNACRFILILSEANAALELPDDAGRQKILWVDDFTEPEAHLFLEQRGILPIAGSTGDQASANVALREHVFCELGRRPLDLCRLTSSLRRLSSDGSLQASELSGLVTAFVKQQQENAEVPLRALIKPGQHASADKFRQLVAKLLDREDHDGVTADQVLGFPEDPKDTATVTKAKPAVLYHIPSKSYRFHSKVHRRAAENWFRKHPEHDPRKHRDYLR